MRKLPRIVSRESTNVSMNEILINLLQQNRSIKLGGKKEEEKVSMKKYLRRSSSQAHRGNAKIWLNHQMMRAVMKKNMMMFALYTG